MNRTHVALADDHTVLRAGLCAQINAQAALVVVGEAATGIETVSLVQETGPRVLCLDLSMPGWGSATTIACVRVVSPDTRILVLTMHDDPAYARAALAAGADGYLLKTAPLSELLAAIRNIATGARVIDKSLQGALAESPQQTADQLQLSRRASEVLQLLANGHAHQDIADRLFLSVQSVETYRARLRAKTGLKSHADFVRYGLEAGLLALPEPTEH